jgi:hypothetical protein
MFGQGCAVAVGVDVAAATPAPADVEPLGVNVADGDVVLAACAIA